MVSQDRTPSNQTPHRPASFTAEYRAFRLANELLDFDHYARNNWLSFRPDVSVDEESPGIPLLPEVLFVKFEAACLLMKRLSQVLEVSDDFRLRLTRDATSALRAAFDCLRHEFAGPTRMHGIAELSKFDEELVRPSDVDRYLMANSPFRSNEWRSMLVPVFRFINRLPRRARMCFGLSALLYLESAYGRRFHRIETTHRDVKEGLPLLFSLITRNTVRLQQEIPPLQGLAFDFSFESFWNDRNKWGIEHWLRTRIGNLHEAIAERLSRLGDDPTPNARKTPWWDSESRELWYGEHRLKAFPPHAKHQCRILDEFEGQNWPITIKDPLVPREHNTPRERLKYAIRALNDGLRKAAAGNSPIEFKQVDNYTSVTWVVQETP
jgi:hypothetical protein